MEVPPINRKGIFFNLTHKKIYIMKVSNSKSIVTVITTILFIVLCMFTVNGVQAQSTSMQSFVPESMVLTLNLNNADNVEVVKTKGTRVIVETTVAVRGGDEAHTIVLNNVKPFIQTNPNGSTIDTAKAINVVNKTGAVVKYRISIPESIKYVTNE